MPSGIYTLNQYNLAKAEGAIQGSAPVEVSYLVVAGGGGAVRGGGGAGGLLQGSVPVPIGSSVTVTVGGGGAGRAIFSTTPGGTGDNSVFGSITAYGGGGGGTDQNISPYDFYGAGQPGGSGGGGAALGTAGTILGGQGVFGQGNAGGQRTIGHNSSPFSSGGGGGAGTVGLNTAATTISGNGGAGVASDISGTRTAYAGGGGGGNYDGTGTVGTGGAGGGGNGALSGNGSAGTANTGGGGGGGPAGGNGGNGGSGIVFVSYPDIYQAASATTGSPTISTSGSGSISFNGTNQNLTYSTTSSFANNGATDFTLECWVYVTGTISGGNFYILDGGSGNQYNSVAINSGVLFVFNGTNYVAATTASTLVVANAWQHLAVVRSGTTVTTYLNGTSVGTSTNIYTFSANSQTLRLGSFQGAANWFPGYITNLRYVNGTAVYTGAFTPPTAPLVPITNTVFLLSAVSGSVFQDSSNSSMSPTGSNTSPPAWNQLSPFATGLGYKNRVYKWTSSGSITF